MIRQKNGVGEFFFFASFKSYVHFSEEDAGFFNSQSLTACQEQTRQVIKISRRRFLEKGVKKTCDINRVLPRKIRPETSLISEPLYFEK